MVGCLAAALPTWGYTVVTDEHVDIVGFTYSAADGMGVRANADSGVYDPADTLFFDGPSGSTAATRPAGGQWDFLGVAAGEPIFIWPVLSEPGRIYAGFEAQSIAPGTFASIPTGDPRAPTAARWLKVSLIDVRFFDLDGTPDSADFALWQFASGAPKVWMSTADGGITGDDIYYQLEGGHSHVNWGFSRAGYYQIDFQLSGVLAGSMQTVSSPVTTWHFGVEHQPMAIPEPGVIGLLVIAGIAVVCRFRISQPKPKQTKV